MENLLEGFKRAADLPVNKYNVLPYKRNSGPFILAMMKTGNG